MGTTQEFCSIRKKKKKKKRIYWAHFHLATNKTVLETGCVMKKNVFH